MMAIDVTRVVLTMICLAELELEEKVFSSDQHVERTARRMQKERPSS